MKQQEYIRKTARKLQCKRKKRTEFTRQLTSDIESALEYGEDWNAIQERLGKPEEVARDFNENLGEAAIAYRKKRTLLLGLVIGIDTVLLLFIVIFGILHFTRSDSNKNPIAASPTPAGDALAKETAIQLSNEMITLFNADDYEGIIDRSNDDIRSSLSAEALQKAKDEIMAGAGEFQVIEENYATHIMERDITYTMVQTKARYANQTVIFTISWDPQNRLCGFYLK